MERLPGFRDFYPEPLPHQDVWSAEVRNYVFDTWRAVARRYGFREYDGPPLEPLELYTAKSGEEIVGQLYHFLDKGERAVALRPEMTPTLARMVAAHARNYKKPLKWFAIPQLFRYERQQKGRLREHFQYNADIFGESSPAADAELIALLIDSLRALGLTSEDFAVRLSSRNAWHEFFQRGRRNAESGTGSVERGRRNAECGTGSVERGTRNAECGTGSVERGMRNLELGTDNAEAFYQVIDKLEREDPAESDRKLQALGFSLDAVKGFVAAAQPTAELDEILRDLAARGLGEFVRVDYGVIRGLAYYTGPVFEAFDRKGEFRAIAGGGRYDGLVKLVSDGRVDLPGLGFGMGDVVLTELLKARGRLPKVLAALNVFALIEDEALRADTLRLVQQLRDAGRSVDYPLTPTKPDKQFKRAVELNAAHTVRLERTASGALSVRLKNVPTRQETVLGPTDLDQLMRLTASPLA